MPARLKNILTILMPMVLLALALWTILIMHPNRYPLWGATRYLQKTIWNPLGHYQYHDYVEVVVVEGRMKELNQLLRDEVIGRSPVLMFIGVVDIANMDTDPVKFRFKTYTDDREEARVFLGDILSNYDYPTTFIRP